MVELWWIRGQNGGVIAGRLPAGLTASFEARRRKVNIGRAGRPLVLAAAMALSAACSSPRDSTVGPTSMHAGTPRVAGSSTIASDTSRQQTLPCSGAPLEPPKDFTVLFDSVALPASPTYPNALQTSSQGGHDSTRLFAKTGLWYRPDQAFEIVGPADQHVRIGWGGGPATPHLAVVFRPCSIAQHGWVVQPGGYWLSATSCASFVVRAQGKQASVSIGLGEPCPGQAPPDGPSHK